MTNNEILQADLLDILFEDRNKLYGAYTLRKTYSRRLGFALGVALSIVLLFILMSFIKKDNTDNGPFKDDRIMILTDVNMEKEEIKKPELPKEKQKPPVAEVDYQPPKIVEDDKVKADLPALNDIDNANISDKNVDGDKPTDIANIKTESNGDGDAVVKEPEKKDEPIGPTREPSFPGGPAAWLKFLQRSLQAPEDIEPGKRIEVYVRFWVDIDGSVSRAEIIKSGGSAFDKEVLRVLKKMPKWEPALQAGRPIAVAYQQPVIFIGQEE
jgi:protein TonB